MKAFLPFLNPANITNQEQIIALHKGILPVTIHRRMQNLKSVNTYL